MKYKFQLLIAAITLLAYGCGPKKSQDTGITISPEAGANYKSGDVVVVKAHFAADLKPDSIVYLVDSVRVASLKDSSALSLKTDSLSLGPRIITAKLYNSGKSQDVSTNIVLLPAKPPVEYTYKVIQTFPHDTGCYTEGLIYKDGRLYESGGGTDTDGIGRSSLRIEELNTGKILKKIMLDPKVFGEGISIVGNKIIQLTWKNPKLGYVYDKDTFTKLTTFTNNVGVEGWGMCFDGNKLYMDDSTNRIWFLDKDTYQQKGFIDVYDEKGPVNEINELEYINGKLYANIYTTDFIIEIDPNTGAVLKRINMENIWPDNKRPARFDSGNVLNGIAYDEQGKRTFVTGKKWPYLYQVEFVKK